MIDRLTGKLAAVDLTEIVVDVNGVGYAVCVPMSTYDRLPRVSGGRIIHLRIGLAPGRRRHEAVGSRELEAVVRCELGG